MLFKLRDVGSDNLPAVLIRLHLEWWWPKELDTNKDREAKETDTTTPWIRMGEDLIQVLFLRFRLECGKLQTDKGIATLLVRNRLVSERLNVHFLELRSTSPGS